MNILYFVLECIGICALFWLICFLGTGSDDKNLKSFRSYPEKLQQLLLDDEDYKNKIKKDNPIVTLISNFITFTVVIFIFGIGFRVKGDYLSCFLGCLIIGEVLNLFDLLVIDLAWFRNVKRTKFTKYPDISLYKDPKPHIISMVKALFMFVAVAAVDGALLMLF